jgi:hypothetical protein
MLRGTKIANTAIITVAVLGDDGGRADDAGLDVLPG